MTINEFLSSLSSCGNKAELIKFTKHNLSNIEDIFFNSNFNDLKSKRLKFSDLIFDLANKELIDFNEDDKSIKGFIIILSDFYDRFRLRDSLNMIYNYIPSSSVKTRVKASKKYHDFDSMDYYNSQFDQVLELLIIHLSKMIMDIAQ